jgi:hypothetical protein
MSVVVVVVYGFWVLGICNSKQHAGWACTWRRKGGIYREKRVGVERPVRVVNKICNETDSGEEELLIYTITI